MPLIFNWNNWNWNAWPFSLLTFFYQALECPEQFVEYAEC